MRADDIHGHAQVRAGSPVPIQTGENWWFPRDMANAIAPAPRDLAMLDVMKIGGVTGWLARDGPCRGRLVAGVEPYLRRDERPSPRGDADGALARNLRRSPMLSSPIPALP